ncbi:MAG: GatB/YqeY domain-containing protein [Candidatus Limnocylindria bacterium]
MEVHLRPMTPEADAAMTLSGRIESAMRDAMRARDEQRTQTLRMAMAAAQNLRIERRRDLTDEEVVDVLSRQVKQRRESIAMYRDAGHEDRAAAEEAEAAILAEFLPEQLSEADVERLVRDAIAETGAVSPADLGRVMGRLSPRTKGRADGRLVSDVVRRLLAG